MEINTSPRRGRPRKTVDVPNAIEEGADATGDNAGNGQAGSVGIEPSPVSNGQTEGFSGFLARVLAAHEASGYLIRTAYHPDADEEIIIHGNGSIPVFKGPEGAFDGNGNAVEI